MFNDVEFENKMRRGQFPALKQSEQIYEEVSFHMGRPFRSEKVCELISIGKENR